MKRIHWCFYFTLVMVAGCNLLSIPSDGDGVAPNPPDVVVYSEQQYWDQLAVNVESGVFNSSDELCSAVDKLVKTGQLKDVSRLVEVRKTRTEPISGDAKSAIISALKGQ